MTRRSIAILVDGGYFLKRLPRLVAEKYRNSPDAIVTQMNLLCRNHVKMLTGHDGKGWLQHVYRIFFYDALPWDGQAQHPTLNTRIDFGKSALAISRIALFQRLKRQRKVALRLGKVVRESDWSPPADKTRRVLASRDGFAALDLEAAQLNGQLALSPEQIATAIELQKKWSAIEDHEIRLGLRQKGVDMRVGLDIASIALKKQADTIVLIAGDSDFVPAAKLARREGMEFILDPLWQQVNDDLYEHIDGLQSGIANPKAKAAKAAPAKPQGAA